MLKAGVAQSQGEKEEYTGWRSASLSSNDKLDERLGDAVLYVESRQLSSTGSFIRHKSNSHYQNKGRHRPNSHSIQARCQAMPTYEHADASPNLSLYSSFPLRPLCETLLRAYLHRRE